MNNDNGPLFKFLYLNSRNDFQNSYLQFCLIYIAETKFHLV